MPEPVVDHRYSRGHIVGLALAAALTGGCWRTDPPILGPDTAARVNAIELETPPGGPPLQPAADTLDLSKKIAPLRLPVKLPKSKVAPAEGRIDVALADVREAALTHNLDIQVEQIRPALARENTAEAEARFEPTGFASYTHSKLDVPEIPRTRIADRSAADNAEIGISVPLQTGGSATVSMPLTRTDFGFPGVPNA